jgi:hypothetical protein
MKKIGAFLIISVMLLSMMFVSSNMNIIAADEVPGPKLRISADEVPGPKLIIAADEVPGPKLRIAADEVPGPKLIIAQG